jgi:hypothetical protein
MGEPQSVTVVIRREQDGFVRDGRPVDATLVQALVTALQAPQIADPEMANLGITPAWLKAQVGSQVPRARIQATETTEGQKALFTASFTDLGVIAGALPQLFDSMTTDDYPGAKVEVVFEDGSKLAAQSLSNFIYMIPWSIDDQSGATFNADISRAVSALLPDKAVNKERLTGPDLAEALADAVMDSIETEWNLRGGEEIVGGALALLRQSYQITATEIGPSHHPEYGTATYKGEPEETNLHATVRKSAFPPNVTVALVLRRVKGRVEGVEKFLKAGSGYEKIALSVPWLNAYIDKNPQIPVRISYVQDASFGEKAMRTFSADMKFRGREDLIDGVRRQRLKIVLLIVGERYRESYWLLFPDRHMVLWRFGGPTGLLKWTPADFSAGKCADYEPVFGGCSGREVTADGVLAPADAPMDQECMAQNRPLRSGISSRGGSLFPVMDRGRGGFIDRKGKLVIPLCFETVGDFSEGLARFERDGKWGFLDTTGAVAIQPSFPWAEDFHEDLAWVQAVGETLASNGRWGFIDRTGKVVIAPEYSESRGVAESEKGFSDGLAMVQKDEWEGRTAYIDKSGAMVITPRFFYASPFKGGMAAVTESESGERSWGYIDKTGMWAIPPEFDWATSFGEGLAAVNRKQNCGYINLKGTFVLRPRVPPGEQDCATVWGGFADGLARWRLGNKFGFVDHTGKFVIEPQFDLTGEFSEGLAAVQIAGKWGYIDTVGKVVIAPRALSAAEAFHNGLAYVVTTDGRHGYIEKTGKYVWKPTRQSIE